MSTDAYHVDRASNYLENSNNFITIIFFDYLILSMLSASGRLLIEAEVLKVKCINVIIELGELVAFYAMCEDAWSMFPLSPLSYRPQVLIPTELASPLAHLSSYPRGLIPMGLASPTSHPGVQA